MDQSVRLEKAGEVAAALSVVNEAVSKYKHTHTHTHTQASTHTHTHTCTKVIL